jgi:hypothetical protein
MDRSVSDGEAYLLFSLTCAIQLLLKTIASVCILIYRLGCLFIFRDIGQCTSPYWRYTSMVTRFDQRRVQPDDIVLSKRCFTVTSSLFVFREIFLEN